MVYQFSLVYTLCIVHTYSIVQYTNSFLMAKKNMEDLSYYRKEWQGADCGTNYELLMQVPSQDKLEEKSKPVFINQRSMHNFNVIYFIFQRQIMAITTKI